MTSSRMGTQYIEEARCRMDLVRLASEKKRYAAVVREAQECVELFLKGAMRLVAVEPARMWIAWRSSLRRWRGIGERAMENMEFVALVCGKLLP